MTGLEQRLALLKTFLSPTRLETPRFQPGHLTIIDLTDPFIDATSACGLFEIAVRLFVRAKVETGKVLLVDEAHKVCQSYIITFYDPQILRLQYLERGMTNGLVKSLLTLIREQRHLAMRVLVSTQGKVKVRYPLALSDASFRANRHPARDS